jgi:hypothetical protein
MNMIETGKYRFANCGPVSAANRLVLRSSRANCRLHLDLEIINRFTSLGEVLKR